MDSSSLEVPAGQTYKEYIAEALAEDDREQTGNTTVSLPSVLIAAYKMTMCAPTPPHPPLPGAQACVIELIFPVHKSCASCPRFPAVLCRLPSYTLPSTP